MVTSAAFLFQQVDRFVNELQIQHPDTLARAMDGVLAEMKPAEETSRHYLAHFLNTYARSDLVGMDAVYVHLDKVLLTELRAHSDSVLW